MWTLLNSPCRKTLSVKYEQVATAADSTVGGNGLPTSEDTVTPPAPPVSAEDVLAAALAGKPIISAPLASSASAAVSATAPSSVDESSAGGVAGLDWLSAAAIEGKKAQRRPSTASAKRSVQGLSKQHMPPPTPTAGPGDWLTSGKLGVLTGDDSDAEDVGAQPGASTGNVSKSKSPKKNKKGKSKRKTSDAGVGPEAVPGGWLAAGIASGTLGVADAPGNDDDSQSGHDEDGVKMTTSSTQWEEGDGEEKLKAPVTTLPPWAKKWTPPIPDPPPADEKEEPAVEIDAKSKVSGLDWINGAISGASADTARGKFQYSDIVLLEMVRWEWLERATVYRVRE